MAKKKIIKYDDLPVQLKAEFLTRHTHIKCVDSRHPDKIVYEEDDVVDLLQVIFTNPDLRKRAAAHFAHMKPIKPAAKVLKAIQEYEKQK